MIFIGLLTDEQKRAGYFVSQDEDFVYIYHRDKGRPRCIEAEAVVQVKALKEKKGQVFRTAILCLVLYPERVMAMLDEIAGLGLTEMKGGNDERR